jgi:hypothetical protein
MPETQPSIFLNHATAELLRSVDGLSQKDVDSLIAGRPYRSWQDVQRVGLGEDSFKGLRSQGVELGEPSSGPIGEPGSGGSAGSGERNLGQA